MAEAFVITPWQNVVGDGPVRRARVIGDYPGIACRDMTGTPAANTPPNPSLVVVRVRCSDVQLVAMQVDTRHFVLYSDLVPADDVPGAVEVNGLRQWLRDNGVRQADLNDAVGNNPNNTRRQVSQLARDWLRQRPRLP